MMVQSVKNGEQRRLLIAQCRTLIYTIALVKQEHIEDIEENTCSDCSPPGMEERLAMLAEAVNESRDTILEFGGRLIASQPLEVCGVKAAGIGPIVWHLANRLLILAESVNGEGDLRPEAESLVLGLIAKFLGDLDTEWLESELSIEAAKKSTVTTVDDDDRYQWQLSEREDFLAVREQLPEGWVKMDENSRSRWVHEVPIIAEPDLEYSKAQLRIMTKCGDTAITKYTKEAGVAIPARGGKNHRYTLKETRKILAAIRDGVQSVSVKRKCETALSEIRNPA